jgi:hypothetical protein
MVMNLANDPCEHYVLFFLVKNSIMAMEVGFK